MKPVKKKRLIIRWMIWTVLWWGLHAFFFAMWYQTVKARPELHLLLFSRHDVMSFIFAAVVYPIGLGKIWLLVERWPATHDRRP